MSSNIPQTPLTFSIDFDVARDVDYTEEFVFSLPKFFGPSSNDVVLSPNTILEATWVSILLRLFACLIVVVWCGVVDNYECLRPV